MHNTSSPKFIIGLVITFFVILCVLFAPLLSVIVLTIVFGTLFDPLNMYLRKKFGSTGAAFITTGLATAAVVVVTMFILVQIVGQVGHLVSGLQAGGILSETVISLIQAKVDLLFPASNINIVSSLESLLSWFTNQLGSVFESIFTMIFTLFLTLMALFYWFKDSRKLREQFLKILPLSTDDTRQILDSLSLSVKSLLRGTLLVVVIQGILAGVGFVIFGVPNAMLWASITVICALVPTLGTALVFVPVVAYLFLTGHTIPAIGIALWGLTAVGLIDNLLGPRLMSRGTNMHPLFTLFAVVGGLQLFGPIGVFAGPLLVSLFFAICKIYSSNQEKSVE